MKQRRHPFIAFLGGTGAGKTTAMQTVADRLGFQPVPEEFQENHFLPLFYDDMRRWGLFSQNFFLINKANQLMKIQKMLSRRPVVLDVAIYQDRCFMDALYDERVVTGSDYRVYDTLYKKVLKHSPAPDLVVYLKTSAQELLRRIRGRARAMEGSVTEQYLEALIRAQEQWVRRNRSKIPVLTIKTDALNFAKDRHAMRTLTDAVKTELKKKGFR
ncbi:MAG: deoxynucleoside kinase [Candidatus Niyogibacteria bacterium]|nr:deoxynucleoside kinase [Candidatus Niyogibacteria bacterium]